MGMYTSHIYQQWQIKKIEYDAMLPIYGNCCKDNGFIRDRNPLLEQNGNYFFTGSPDEYKEMEQRCIYLED